MPEPRDGKEDQGKAIICAGRGMTSDEFVRMVVQGAVQLMMERDGMILAKEFEGELWIKASDYYDEVNRSVAAEREACAALCDGWPDYNVQGLAETIRARGQE